MLLMDGDVPPRTTGACGYVHGEYSKGEEYIYSRIINFIQELLQKSRNSNYRTLYDERFLFVFGGRHGYEEDELYIDDVNNMLFR